MTPSSPLSPALPSSPPDSLPVPSAREAPGAAGGARDGRVLVLLVAALAFLLASFPAHNSDVWLHLARGRLLAHGQLPASQSPDLAFERWGNQTWLYDLCCYLCHSLLGGAGLVLGKALLTAGMALLLLRQSRSGPGWSLPAACTSLALLAMSLHLLLQPATASYFLLALALLLLGRPAAEEGTSPSLASWPLLLVFVAWANLDRWFVLGQAVVALVWLGETLDEALSRRATAGRWQANLPRRALALVALVAVCLLNPSHVHAFTRIDEHLLGASSFGHAFLRRAGQSPATLAYFLLLGLSLLSFVAVLPRWSWRRFLPWLGLALASALGVRAIPFFAVVAGPVLAGNLQEILAHRFAWESGAPTRASRLGRALAFLLVAGLVVCAWPGWLQAPPFGPRRWAVDLPLSLQRGAAAVHRWRQEGKLAADSRGLHLSATTIYAFAWFCPEDSRLELATEDSPAEGRRRMRAAHVDHILVHDTDRDRLMASLGGLVADPEQWPLLYQEGGLAIFGWRDPAQPGSAERFRGWQLDVDRLAFHPADDKKAPADPAETQTPARSWWEAFWKPAPLRSTDRQEALMCVLHAEVLRRQAPLRHLASWENSQAAALVGAAAGWTPATGIYEAPLRLELLRPTLPENGSRALPPTPLARRVMDLQRGYVWQRDDAPPALYYLAVRAARRAVASNPDDAAAYLLLGESYLALLEGTRERTWGDQVKKLVRIRQAQASAALNRALALEPELARAHLLLSRLYQEMDYLDLALEHFRDFSRLDREARGAESEARRARQEKDVDRLAREVEKRQNRFTLACQERTPRDHPFLAFQNGLAGKALELLLDSHLAAFGTEGMELELELLLGTGRARDVQDWLSPEHEATLGPASYHWFLTRAAAALGDYTRAQEECARASQGLGLRPGFSQPMRFREGMALLIAKLLLDEQTGGGAPPSEVRTPLGRVEFSTQIRTLADMLRNQAELSVLRGLFALEEGDVDEAESAFQTALDVWKSPSAADCGAGLDFKGRDIAATCLGWLTREP